MCFNLIYTHCPPDPLRILPTHVPPNFMSSFFKKSDIFDIIFFILENFTPANNEICSYLPPIFPSISSWINSPNISLSQHDVFFFSL